MKRSTNETQEEWIKKVDEALFGIWNTAGFTYSFHGIYAGDQTSELLYIKDKESKIYKYTIDLEGKEENVILSITFNNKVICIYKISEIEIHPRRKLVLIDSLGNEIKFFSQE
jgi:uncharacterized protein YuzE